MKFFLFLILNAALFLRPTELIPGFENAPIYEILILACLGASLPALVRQLRWRSLAARPISVCIIGLQGVVVVSGFLNLGPEVAFHSGFEFFKLLLYYLLLLAVLDTPKKLRVFIYYLGGLIFCLTMFALLQYHQLIEIPALASYAERQEGSMPELASNAERQPDIIDEETGKEGGVVLLRLCAAGIYNNPNDLSRILVVGILISLYGWYDRRFLLVRFLWSVPLGVFCYALHLTHSRGGFLCLLAALMVFLGARFGGRKLIWLSLVLLPLLFLTFSGRQTNLTTSEGTGQQRIQIWSDGFSLLKTRPLFGIGMEQYGEQLGIEAHNSFVHAYTELGIIGGTFFLAAYYLASCCPIEWAGWGHGLARRN